MLINDFYLVRSDDLCARTESIIDWVQEGNIEVSNVYRIGKKWLEIWGKRTELLGFIAGANNQRVAFKYIDIV